MKNISDNQLLQIVNHEIQALFNFNIILYCIKVMNVIPGIYQGDYSFRF